MLTYVFVSIGSGLILAISDVFINANPIGRKIYVHYQPIARERISPFLGILIDSAYGFILAGFYLIIHRTLPGPPGLFRAIEFGFIVWVLRTLMNSISQWITFDIPAHIHLYTIFTGLIQTLTIALLYGLTLDPIP